MKKTKSIIADKFYNENKSKQSNNLFKIIQLALLGLIVLSIFGIGYILFTERINTPLIVIERNYSDSPGEITQVTKRLDDGIQFIIAIVTFVGAIITGFSILLGLNIWQTRAYAKRLINNEYLKLEREKIPAIISASEKQLLNISGINQKIQANSASVIFDSINDMYDKSIISEMESKNHKKGDIEKIIKNLEKEGYRRKQIMINMISLQSMFRNDVENAAQNLSALADSDALRTRLDESISLIENLIDEWDGSTRTELVRALDDIKRVKRNQSDD